MRETRDGAAVTRGAAHQHVALVFQLAGHQRPRQGKRERRIASHAMLRLPQQHVAAGGAFKTRLESAGCIEKHERDPIIREPVHQRRAQPDVPEADDRLQVMQWYAQPRLGAHFDAQGVIVQTQLALGRATYKVLRSCTLLSLAALVGDTASVALGCARCRRQQRPLAQTASRQDAEAAFHVRRRGDDAQNPFGRLARSIVRLTQQHDRRRSWKPTAKHELGVVRVKRQKPATFRTGESENVAVDHAGVLFGDGQHI